MESALQRHMDRSHRHIDDENNPDKAGGAFDCMRCGASYTTKRFLLMHLKAKHANEATILKYTGGNKNMPDEKKGKKDDEKSKDSKDPKDNKKPGDKRDPKNKKSASYGGVTDMRERRKALMQ